MDIPEDKVMLDLNFYRNITYELEHYRKEQAVGKAFIASKDMWEEFIAWRVAQRLEE